MDENGLLDFRLVSFVFAPLALTVTVLSCIWWNRIKKGRATFPAMDTAGLLLTAAVRKIPEERREWGKAMMTELSHIRSLPARWRFAVGCVPVALFPPRSGDLSNPNPVCGFLAITLPPLGLPFLYLTALLLEALLKQEGISLSESYPGLGRTIGLFSLACVLAGLPLGLGGLLRHERSRGLSWMGMLSSLCIITYFFVVMNFISGGPNGD